MAKGKHAAALFEVIHSGRFPNKPEMRTPKWWFKRKSKDPASTAGDERTGEAAEASHDPSDPTTGATARAMLGGVVPARSESSTRDATAAAADRYGADRHSTDHFPDIRRGDERGDSDSDAPRSVDVSVDPKKHQITFRVTYSSAAITAFAIVVVVGLAYIVGRKMSAGPSVAVATETTEQVRARSPRPAVLNVSPPPANSSSGSTANSQRNGPGNSPTSSTPPREPDSGITSRTNDPRAAGGNAASPNAASPNTANANNGSNVNPAHNATFGEQGRIVGLNYVVIQSYPDEKTATEVRDMVLQAGIGCTVEETKLRGLNFGWFHVVGTQGFQRISGQDYEAYYTRLEQLSRQFAQGKRSFKGFALLPYKWDKPQ